jgi:hypothetical protein
MLKGPILHDFEVVMIRPISRDFDVMLTGPISLDFFRLKKMAGNGELLLR